MSEHTPIKGILKKKKQVRFAAAVAVRHIEKSTSDRNGVVERRIKVCEMNDGSSVYIVKRVYVHGKIVGVAIGYSDSHRTINFESPTCLTVEDYVKEIAKTMREKDEMLQKMSKKRY